MGETRTFLAEGMRSSSELLLLRSLLFIGTTILFRARLLLTVCDRLYICTILPVYAVYVFTL